jgi:hypothetical protein
MNTMMMSMFGVAIIGLALAASSAQAAELIVYEGFDLTDRANGADLDGSAGGSSSIGLTGTWETTAANNMTYQSSGLSWTYEDPDVSPVGGAVNSGQTSQGYVKGGRNLPALSGSTVWGSFLTKGSALTGPGSPLGLPVGGTTLDSLYGEFCIEPKGYNSQSTIAVDATARLNATAGSSWMSVNTTYMALFKIDNINVDGADVGVSLWLMTQGQYDNLIRRGVSEDVLEAGLNSATLGTADSQLWGRVRGNYDLAPGNAVSWAAGHWLRMINNTANNAVTFDEIRLATTLGAAAVIPKPKGTVVFIR